MRLTPESELVEGYNEIKANNNNHIGYLLVNLLKSDFQFNCTQTLKLGQVNHVALGTHTDYKPSGAMIGAYTPTIKIIYNNQTITAEYDTDDYYFNLDLTDISEPSKVKFKVIIETNDVINHTETDVTLNCDYETITTLTGLTTLFSNGGIGKLGANLTLTSNQTLNKPVMLIGNNKTLNLNGKQLIIKDTFKAEDLTFTGGVNTLYQKTGSKVELTDCAFTNNTGIGSCIRCDIDLQSLDNPNDYHTVLTDCLFSNNDLCILHGGELTVTGCNVTGKISDKEYPYFLYLTDGDAYITGSNFNIKPRVRKSVLPQQGHSVGT